MVANVRNTIGSVRRGFTMIELVIALVIIIVAVLSIMVLFPIGMQANRSSLGRSSAYTAVEQFLHLTATRIRHDWHVVDAFPNDEKPFPDGDPAYRMWSTKSLATSDYVEILWLVESGDASADFDPSVHNSGLFRVNRLNASGGVDFSVIVRAWKEVTDYGDGSDGSAKTLTLNAEVSWPADFPYARRDKSVFQTVLFNPGEVSNLVIEIKDDYIYESQADGTNATVGTVTRVFGDMSQPLAVDLSSDDTSEAVPAVSSLTIPAGVSAATFGIQAVDDALTDGRQIVTITASDSRYPADDKAYRPGRDSVSVIDDETPELQVVVAKNSMSENGGQSEGSVTRIGDNASKPLVVFIVSRDRLEAVPTPNPLTLKANQTSASFQLNAVDDNLLDGDKTVEITAAAKGYSAIPDSIVVTDFETLAVSVAPSAISESAGAGAAVGTVTRSNTNVENALSVSLAASDASAIGVPSSVTIPAGSQSVTFDIDAIDDNIAEAPQTVVQINAFASGYINSPGSITVNDDEVLSLSLAAASVSENGGSGVTTGVVTRNIDNPDDALLVNLASSDTGEAVCPAQVVIPAGAKTASFAIDAVDDNILDGSNTVTITASAGGFASASQQLVVTDYETLTIALTHDAVMESATNPATTATVTRSNTDPADPAFGQPIRVTLVNSDDSEITLPASALIPARHASASFAINVVSDHVFDGDQTVTVSATGTGYVSVPDDLLVMDSDLEVTINPTTIYESAAAGVVTATGTVKRSQAGVGMQVNIVSGDTTEAKVSPASVTFGINDLTASFTVTAQDDNEVDGTQNVVITAYNSDVSGQASVAVADDDAAALALSLSVSPDRVEKGTGLAASTGTVTRTGDVTDALTVTLVCSEVTNGLNSVMANSDTNLATVPATVTFAAGSSSTTFAIDAPDVAVGDTTQTERPYAITASATGYGNGTANITVWWPVVPDCYAISGNLGINPNNSGQEMEFYVVTDGDETFGRDDLWAEDSHIDDNGVYYSGKVKLLRVKPKGGSNSVIYDGKVYTLQNSTTYTFTGDDLDVVVYNTHVKKGRALGQWYVALSATCSVIKE